MRRRCSIVVAATTATETAARTMTTMKTDSWSIRHRHSRWIFRPLKNTFSILLFSSSVRERDRIKPAHGVCQRVAAAAAQTLPAHTLPHWVAARCAGRLHGAHLPDFRDTGGQLSLG